ncbi:dienelactone hydrolase [Lasiosphaeris hirsuta]|uniref:Dienelactone hydrolase n=1 Tax=Lasiosphaeris hirsuta TaxID=260670 RepID=A0AA40A9X5_9PEZI|nr:dienelactone hydrolase [Lasiosphaeris hirsuta]
MRAATVSTLLSALLLSGVAGATPGAPWRVGAQQDSCAAVDASIVAHNGTTKGVEETHNGLRVYITKPDPTSSRTKAREGTAVLYLTDVFGIELAANKLLADSFARAGYLTIAPDLFSGENASGDINVPGFNTSAFLAKHGPDVTDPIIAQTMALLRTTLGVRKIGLTGYCFGGRYAFRFAAAGKGGDAAFAAHPSLLEDGEIKAIKAPAAIAAAETDSMMSPARRGEVEGLLGATKVPYQVSLYSGTSHGFGVRADVSVPVQRFGKEEAFLQAVRWFDNFL